MVTLAALDPRRGVSRLSPTSFAAFGIECPSAMWFAKRSRRPGVSFLAGMGML